MMQESFCKEQMSVLLLKFSLASVILFVFACSNSELQNGIDDVSLDDDVHIVQDSLRVDSQDSIAAIANTGDHADGNSVVQTSSCSQKTKNESDKSSSSTGGTSVNIVVADSLRELLPPAGFYKKLTIPVPPSRHGGTIRCTFDGSMPATTTPAFVEPYVLEKNTPVRCAEFVDDSIVRMSSSTFFIGEKVDMPIVSICVNPDSMFDPEVGYYSQGVASCTEPCYEANYWLDLELPVHVEFFEKGSSSDSVSWQIEAGLAITGNWSRYWPKKSIAIKMRAQYQDGRLKYPIFKTRPEHNKFKAFNLRNNGNRFIGDYFEDPVLSSLLEGSGVDYQRSRQVVVFINGEYYGIYDLRERLNEHYVETNYGIDSKQVNVVKHDWKTVSVNGGSEELYLALLDFIHANDFAKDSGAYEQLALMMDIGNYADYMAAEIYFHNGDWPQSNVRAWGTANRPFKFIVYDLDHGFGWDWAVRGFDCVNHNMFEWIKQGGKSFCKGDHCFPEIYIKLIQNPDFRRLFINHSAVMLDYYLTYDRLVSAIDQVLKSIPESEMDRDMLRYPREMHYFDKTGETLLSFAATRTEILRDEYREEFGLGRDISVTIASKGNGTVLLDGMKLPNSNYTGTFFDGNDMLLQATSTNGGVFVEWDDGIRDNPRLISPEDGSTYTAIFK